MPKWMSGIDALSPAKVFALGLLLAGGQSEEPHARRHRRGGPGAARALSTSDAVVSLLVFVIVGSLTIACPVVYYLVGGDDFASRLNEMEDWLAPHNEAVPAVPAVVFLMFGVDLIAKGRPPLT
jgi:hypothetical protein